MKYSTWGLVDNNFPKPELINRTESAAIFAKACFGHPSPSKRQKLRGSQCLRRPQPSCFIRWIPSKGYPTSFSQ
ncbi:hypothetical protein [Methylobacter tundripaludum]|uniref:hypothetical protein n=1 Tax=Methylobacter tundripaludum TaxID=173365 RepID=UPI0012375375|nr:hypothetical protein [Methylobacter tundripaludum]